MIGRNHIGSEEQGIWAVHITLALSHRLSGLEVLCSTIFFNSSRSKGGFRFCFHCVVVCLYLFWHQSYIGTGNSMFSFTKRSGWFENREHVYISDTWHYTMSIHMEFIVLGSSCIEITTVILLVKDLHYSFKFMITGCFAGIRLWLVNIFAI